MLASTLMRQHSRCLSGFSRQILSQQNVKLPKNSLVPTQCLTTSPALQHGSGDHTKMWSAERVVSLIQIPAVIVPFMWTTPATDALFCTLAVLHSHWGKSIFEMNQSHELFFDSSYRFYQNSWMRDPR